MKLLDRVGGWLHEHGSRWRCVRLFILSRCIRIRIRTRACLCFHSLQHWLQDVRWPCVELCAMLLSEK